MNGNRGLFRVARADLFAALAHGDGSGGSMAGTRSRFGRGVRSMSFPTREGNGTGQPAGWRAPDGTLLFSTIDGLVSVDATDLTPRAGPPGPGIESLTVDGVPQPLDGSAEAAPGAGDLVVQFVAARLRRPELLRFEYRLAEPEAAWTPVSTGRIVHVAQVPPGQHRFELRALDDDDRASPMPCAVEFGIRPAWHQYVAVRIAVIAVLGAVVGLLVRRRIRNLRAQATALAREVDQRRQAEQALREEQAQKLLLQEQLDHARRLEAIGRLAGGVAHDFNNLLTVAVSCVDLLRQELDAPPGSSVAEYLDELNGFTDSASRLTRQLLAFGRRQHLRPVAVDLAEVVRTLLPMLRRLVRSDIAVEVHAVPASVHADLGQLEQALVNLVANAALAIEGAGTIRVGVSHASPEAAAERWPDLALEATHACLTLDDTGKGIPPEVLPLIFEPFFTTRPGGKGTGLGLASVHGFVQQSHGHIRVSSTVGQGTRFEIFLPGPGEKTAAGPVSAPPAQAPPPRGTGTVLLCDDNTPVRRRLANVLVAFGYRVREAEDGDVALELIRAGEPVDVLVTDVVMPRMNGPTLASRARALRPDLPVVFITGYAPDALEGIPEHGTCVLHKPFAPADLAETLRTLIGKRPGRS